MVDFLLLQETHIILLELIVNRLKVQDLFPRRLDLREFLSHFGELVFEFFSESLVLLVLTDLSEGRGLAVGVVGVEVDGLHSLQDVSGVVGELVG